MLAGDKTVALGPGFRLQYEEAQQGYVLLYPEGMVELNDAAAAILKLCVTPTRIDALLTDLRGEFDGEGLEGDVGDFLEVASARGWININ